MLEPFVTRPVGSTSAIPGGTVNLFNERLINLAIRRAYRGAPRRTYLYYIFQ